MSRSPLRRIGTIALTIAIGTFGLTPPALAATPGTIAGTLTYHGAAVANASVYASPDLGGDGGWATTDAAGHYSIPGLEPGAYRVIFSPQNRPDQYAYGKISQDTANLITVTSGATTTVNDSVLDTGTISGVLTDNHGTPVPNAWVSASSPTGTYGFAVTASDGSYAIAVFPGSYTVSFRVGSIEQFAHGKGYEDADVFTVTANATTTVNETLKATGAIAGHVTRSDGSAAAGVQVEAIDVHGGTANTTTDDTGAYRIDYLAVASYQVLFTLPSGAAQYAHDLRSDTAPAFAVGDGQTLTVDESLLPTGSITGRLVAQDGSGIADASVGVSSRLSREWGLATQTDANGYYTIGEVFADTGYKVHFAQWDLHIDQWATSKLLEADADTFTVTGGAATTVNDTRLPTGSVKVTAKDSVTGAAITAFYAYIGDVSGQATTGSVVLTEVSAGPRTLQLSSVGYNYTEVPITVTAGQETAITVTMVPTGKLKVKVVDKVTGAGLQDFVVLAMKPGDFYMPDGIGERTAADGSLTVEVGQGGPYHLFVYPKNGSGYGAQWVGTVGGTGSELSAATFTVANGQSITVPTIKMDKAGTITGKVTSETGKAVKYGTVTMAPQSYHSGGGFGEVPVAADGTYKIDFLGPYTWPLLFRADGHAFQWSDGTADRYHRIPQRRTPPTGSGTAGAAGTTTITPVQPAGPDRTTIVPRTRTGEPRIFGGTSATGTTTTVTSPTTVRTPRVLFPGIRVFSGKTTVFNYTLKVGVSVKTPAPGISAGGFVDVYNAVTGDFIGSAWADDLGPGATNLLIPGSRVKFRLIDNKFHWCGGVDFAHAPTYTVTTAATQNFTCVVS